MIRERTEDMTQLSAAPLPGRISKPISDGRYRNHGEGTARTTEERAKSYSALGIINRRSDADK